MENRVNLSPLHWGPKTWFFLESAALAYPTTPTESEKTSAKNLITSLKDLLPCENCRINYNNYLVAVLKKNNIDDIVKDRNTFITFILDVHNDVRTKNGQNTRTIEEIFEYYKEEYSKPAPQLESFLNDKDKPKSIESFRNKKDTVENMSDFKSDMLFHFNPITLLIGIMVGLIIYKFFMDSESECKSS
jgi:hypothetical protein